jgi:uncharacterized protein (DUF952 family)
MGDIIYKICSREAWSLAITEGVYAGSPDDARDGFIHFSHEHQLRTTAMKYFSGRDDLWLVAVNADALGTALRREPSRGGELFPHLYAALSLHAVLWSRPLPWNGSGHDWPGDLVSLHSKL